MGWIKKTRDTGWRDVTQEMQSSAAHVSGRLLVRRERDVVTVFFDQLVVDRSGTATLIILPSEFRPFHVERTAWWEPDTASATAGGTVNANANGYVVGYLLAAGRPMTARIQYDCPRGWPSSYPGEEVQL